MHLVFIPVVHTTDKKGNSIDKIACSEFWKAKDSYRQLQDAFYEYMIKNQFQLERGNAENRVHLSVEDYKKVTGFNKTETILKDIKLELPDIPNINEFNKLSLNRDKKIEKEIIKPKDELIEKLHQDNIRLYKELDKQVEIISKAEEVEKENVKLNSHNFYEKYGEFISCVLRDIPGIIVPLQRLWRNTYLEQIIQKNKIETMKISKELFNCVESHSLAKYFLLGEMLNTQDFRKEQLKKELINYSDFLKN